MQRNVHPVQSIPPTPPVLQPALNGGYGGDGGGGSGASGANFECPSVFSNQAYTPRAVYTDNYAQYRGLRNEPLQYVPNDPTLCAAAAGASGLSANKLRAAMKKIPTKADRLRTWSRMCDARFAEQNRTFDRIDPENVDVMTATECVDNCDVCYYEEATRVPSHRITQWAQRNSKDYKHRLNTVQMDTGDWQ